MNFNHQLKEIRKQHKMTQKDLAEKLNTSRQTISSWENKRNLPDIEMIILISKTFGVSLDTLILGDESMTNKLVEDGNKIKKLRLSILSLILLVAGIICSILFFAIPSYIDENGILREPWILVPLGLTLSISGILVGITNLLFIFFKKTKY